MVDLGTLGGRSGSAYALNEKGQVVGYSSTAGDAQTHATMWLTASMPPTTSATLTSPSGSSAAGWYREPVTVTLTATDDRGPSGVARILYRIGAGPEIATDGDSVSFAISAEGQMAVSFHAQDRDGNDETPNTLTVTLDRTAPTITFATPSVGLTFLQHESVTATYTCGDVLSAVASCAGPVSSAHNYPTTTPGGFTFFVHARDDADNDVLAAQGYSVITPVDVIESPLAVVREFHLTPRIARPIAARLRSALAALTGPNPEKHHKDAIRELQAARFEINAQRGAGLTHDQANILIAAIERIIAVL